MSSPDRGRDHTALFTLLYVSELAEGGAVEVDQICRESRDNNARDGITGLLVFDGHAFCQFIEGSEAKVTSLRERLERDSRHVAMNILQLGRTPRRRRFSSWRLGYAYAADPAAIARIAGARGADALAALSDLVPAAERERPRRLAGR